MKCPNHITKDVSGYCSVCGTFVCEICLKTHEGQSYCPKHFKPIENKLKISGEIETVRRRHGRHHLIVRFTDGKKALGTCRSMNLREAGFYLEREDETGISTDESMRVQFVDVKYVAHVKSYSGKFNRDDEYQQYNPGGSHIVVRYKDGEIQEGVTMHAYVPGHPRFYLIPLDPNSNSINILVEASAVERVYTPQEYKALLAQEKEAKKQHKQAAKEAKHAHTDTPFDSDAGALREGEEEEESTLSQEESMGDFYFETHNYPGALEQYEAARRAHPTSSRLQRKAVVATVNIGIQYIKTREYPKALGYMESALGIDPKNPHARKKAKQLKKIIEKTERRMREYYEQQSKGSGESPDL